MNLLVFLLAVNVAASPAPLPPSLTPLKVIGNVRSTPFCTALRQTIGPAIAGVLSNDELIATSKPAFTTLYQDDILARSDARTHFDMYRLEKLIGPIAANLKRIDALLSAKPDDSKLQAMRDKLLAVVKQQKDSLNVVSGFVSTAQLGEIQNDDGFPDNWKNVFVAAPQTASRPGASIAPPPASNNVFSAGVHSGPATDSDPRYKSGNVGPTYDPFAQFVDQIEAERALAQASESDAARLVLAALPQCTP